MSETPTFPVTAHFSESRGEGWSASRPVTQGQIVLRVAALSSVPRDCFLDKVCAGCFRPATVAAPLGKPPEHTDFLQGQKGMVRPAPMVDGSAWRSSHVGYDDLGNNDPEVAPSTSRRRPSGGENARVHGDSHHKAGASPGIPSDPDLDLRICPTCRFVSFCNRCRTSQWFIWRHSTECESLSLLRSEQSQTVLLPPSPDSPPRTLAVSHGVTPETSNGVKSRFPASEVDVMTDGLLWFIYPTIIAHQF